MALVVFLTFLFGCEARLGDGNPGWTVDGELAVPQWSTTTDYDGLTEADLYGLWVAPRGNIGWAVGEKGVILELRSATEWRVSPNTSLTDFYLKAVAASDDGKNAWAVGDGGVMLSYGNNEWTKAPSVTEAGLTTVWVSKDGSVGWALGQMGVVLQLVDGNWQVAEVGDHRDGISGSWFDTEGSRGWAVGFDGTVLELRNGEWSLDATASSLTNTWLRAVHMSADGSEGIAVGDDGVALSFRNGSWRTTPTGARDGRGPDMPGEALALWTSDDLTRGWAVGDSFLRLDGTTWHDAPLASAFVDLSVNALQIANDESWGWAVGLRGTIFRYEHERWSLDFRASSRRGTLKKVTNAALSEDGRRGWAVGARGSVLELVDGHWRINERASSTTANWLARLWLSEDGRQGWTVGEDGAIFHLRKGVLEPVARPTQLRPDTSANLFELAMGQDGRGWAFGRVLEKDTDSARQLLLRFDGATWQREDAPTEGDLRAAAVSHDGTRGWAVGGAGLMLELDRGQWRERPELTKELTVNEALLSVALSKDASRGWALGARGTVLRLEEGAWRKQERGIPTVRAWDRLYYSKDVDGGWAWSGDSRVFAIRGNVWTELTDNFGDDDVLEIAATSDLEHAWAFGGRGSVYRMNRLTFDTAQFDPLPVAGTRTKLNELQVSTRLRLPPDLTKSIEIDVELVIGDSVSKLESGRHWTRQHDVVHVHGKDELIALHARKSARLRIRITRPTSEGAVTLTSRAFFVAGIPPWLYVMVAALALFGINLILVASSPFLRRTRQWLLAPRSGLAIGLGIGRLLTWPLLFRVRPVVRALMRHYRTNLGDMPRLVRWTTDKYIAPDLRLDGGSSTHEDALNHITANGDGQLWTVIGPSGLGKSALLETWTRLLLDDARTPVLLPLTGARSAEQVFADALARYGETEVDPATARTLLEAGGFVVLLDGLNEDHDPVATGDFVRRILRNNIVVVGSQSAPDWPALSYRNVELQLFGNEQLRELGLSEQNLCALEERPHIDKLCRLPYTAELLTLHIRDHGEVPELHVDIYDALHARFEHACANIGATKLLHLEDRAWDKFTTNEVLFDVDDNGPVRSLYEIAVEVGIVTRSANQWRFRHELIHRYFVARYVVRNAHVADEELWQKRVHGARYWQRALCFTCELKAKSAIEEGANFDAYERWLLLIANFDKDIFGTAYEDARRLERAQKLTLSRTFRRLAADVGNRRDGAESTVDPANALRQLMRSAFNRDTLVHFLDDLPNGRDAVDSLTTPATLFTSVREAVVWLEENRRVNGALFQALLEARPLLREDITPVAWLYGIELPTQQHD